MPTGTPRAQSNYRQVQFVFTESAGGQVSFRVMAKPVHKEWTFKHHVHRAHFRMSDPPVTLDDVYRLVARLVSDLAPDPPVE